jgi:DNA invertase Pin-like site-specific DNA recombinase
LISERTKAALRAKKKAGHKLGNPIGFTKQSQRQATATKRQKAKNNANTQKAKQMIKEMIQLAQFQNISLTIKTVAERLNQYNLKTATGQTFTPENVRYFIKPVLADMNLKQLPKAG